MRYERIWSVVLLFFAGNLYSAFSGEKPDMTPRIAVSRIEDGVLFVELTNTSDGVIMVDMTRNQQGVIRCVHLLVKATSGAVLTTNDVFADGYWNPCALESQVTLAKEYQKDLVGIPAASSVFFTVPIQPFIRSVTRDRIKVGLVSPKLVYFTTDGAKHETTGRFFSIAETLK